MQAKATSKSEGYPVSCHLNFRSISMYISKEVACLEGWRVFHRTCHAVYPFPKERQALSMIYKTITQFNQLSVMKILVVWLWNYSIPGIFEVEKSRMTSKVNLYSLIVFQQFIASDTNPPYNLQFQLIFQQEVRVHRYSSPLVPMDLPVPQVEWLGKVVSPFKRFLR